MIQQARWASEAGPEVLRAVIESAPTALVMVDAAGSIVLANAEAERLFRYPRDEMIGMGIEDLVPERFRSLHPAYRTGYFYQPHARGMGQGRDLYGLRRDGTEFPIQIGLNPISTAHGAFVLSAIVDLTERKRMEARFRATVESAPTAMVMIDRQGMIVLVNGETEKMFGHRREALLGRPIESLIPVRFRMAHPGMREAFFQLPEARRMGVGRDLFGVRADGSEFPIEIGLNPVETDEGTFVLSAIVDITERKEIEGRFRLAVDAAPVAMLMTDSAGRIELANREALRLFGYAPGELVGQPLEVLIPGQFRGRHPHLRQNYQDKPESRRMGEGRVLHARRKDGVEVPVEIGLSPLSTAEGKVVLSVIVDISERVAAEEAQRKLNEELERRVSKRTAELGHAIEALTESNVELQQFAYVASHDLQTPLRGIAGCAQILEAEYAGAVDEAGRAIIRRMVQSTVHLQSMIRDLLAYSRIEARDRPFGPVDLEAVLAETKALLEATVLEARATITHDPLPTVTGDRTQLVQLFSNVIGNAVKYRADRPPAVHVSATREDAETWRISVRDNGIGIAAEHLEKVFEVFTRLHTQAAYPGTGIGLAVCRRVVGRHNGRIWVESAAGAGSTFHFTLGNVGAQASAQLGGKRS